MHFRTAKKLDKAKKDADDAVKNKYALPEELALVADDSSMKVEAKEAFSQGRLEHRADADAKRRRLAAELGSLGAVSRPSSSLSSQSRLLLPNRPKSFAGKNRSSTAEAAGASFSLRSRLIQNTARHSDPFLKRDQFKALDAKALGVNLKR